MCRISNARSMCSAYCNQNEQKNNLAIYENNFYFPTPDEVLDWGWNGDFIRYYIISDKFSCLHSFMFIWNGVLDNVIGAVLFKSQETYFCIISNLHSNQQKIQRRVRTAPTSRNAPLPRLLDLLSIEPQNCFEILHHQC